MFIYNSLARDTLEIRLVRLTESPVPDTRISLELRHASIDDGNYSALSYVWGDMGNPVEISVNAALFLIGKNLYLGLKQLRDNDMCDWIWVDSLCIQQTDVEEKSHQVGLMRTIFSRADRVYSWLRQGFLSTDTAMDFISRVGPRATAVGASKMVDHYDEIRNFIRETYPSSIEIGTLRAEDTAGFFRYEELRSFIKEICPKPIEVETFEAENPVGLVHRPSELAMFVLDLLKELGLQDKPTSEELLMWAIKDLMHRDYWQRIWINQEVALARDVIILCGTQNIVFALLGVVTDNQKLGLQPDYNMSMNEVFATKARAMYDNVKENWNLDICEPRKENPDSLPSWVIDWRKIGQGGATTIPIRYSACFNAAGRKTVPHPTYLSGDDTLGILRRHGCRADVITEVWQPCPMVYYKDTATMLERNRESLLSSIVEFVQLPHESGSGEEYVWRTLLSRDWYVDVNAFTSPEILSLIRKIMRQQSIDPNNLTTTQQSFVDRSQGKRSWTIERQGPRDTASKLAKSVKNLQLSAFSIASGRTLFKTTKSMLGLGHTAVLLGDIVTLLWGIPSPIVLRPRDESSGGGFTLREMHM
ncbi:hypothetical protein ACHAPJ_007475 [Fusarium lateritium]